MLTTQLFLREAVMRYVVTLDGIPFGEVELVGAPRAIGTLRPDHAYAARGLRKRACALGIALRLVGSDRVERSRTSRALAAAVAQMHVLQDRLGLRDADGRSVAIVHVIVVEFPRDRQPLVVAQLREQASPVLAEPYTRIGQPGDQSRPAA
jgi:hypothetical protein